MIRPNWIVRFSVLALASAVAWGCQSQERADARREAIDTLTQRQRDSLLSTMPVPGASAVGRALRVADSAAARAQRHDTIR